MTIANGDKIPEATLTQMTADGPSQVRTSDYFAGRTIALFAVPGAFTPTCSARHLPGFLDKSAELRAKGVDEIACVAVNDPFVMGAWGKANDADGKVTMLADGNGDFARALGLEVDLSAAGLGKRSGRYSMLVKDGKVAVLNVEASPGGLDVSSAEHLLTQI